MTRPAIKSSLTNTAGGFLVPTPLEKLLFKNIQCKSAILPFLRKFTMTSATLRLNAIDDEPVMAWVATEGGSKEVSNESIRQITLTAEELSVIVLTTKILLADSNVELISVIREEIEDAIVVALEQSYMGYFAGTPFAQTLTLSTPVAHTIAFGTHTDLIDDMNEAVNTIEVHGHFDNIGFVAHTTLMATLRGLRDGQGQPIFRAGAKDETPDTLFGYPIRFTCNMQQTGSPPAYELLIADWKYVLEGVRSGVEIDIFDTGTVGAHNLLVQNKIAVRATLRRGFAIRDVNALAKVTGL